MEKAKYIKILVVEDDEEMRLMLEKAVAKEGFSPLTAENGKDALKIIDENKDIALIISDIKMPECGGLPLLEETIKKKPDMPFILITGFGDVEQYLEAMNLGAYEYLNKPFKIQDLMDIVYRVLRKNKAL